MTSDLNVRTLLHGFCVPLFSAASNSYVTIVDIRHYVMRQLWRVVIRQDIIHVRDFENLRVKATA